MAKEPEKQSIDPPLVLPRDALILQTGAPSIETIRIECLKVALELRAGGSTDRMLIDRAKTLEAYVTGQPAETAGR